MTDFRSNTSLPRGIRNNNPGNIRYDGTSWQGAVGQDDSSFVIFSDDTWGIRALATDLSNKINNDGLTTIREIISAYAPAADNNNVDAYVSAVSSSTGIGPDDQLSYDTTTLHSLIRAIMDHENGDSSEISDADVDQGISMMGNSLSTLLQAGAVAITNNTDNSAWIAGAVIVAIVGIVIYKSKRK